MPDKDTHVAFVSGDAKYPSPLFFKSLRAATEGCEKIITENPDAKCAVFQLRVELTGKIEILREDYNKTA